GPGHMGGLFAAGSRRRSAFPGYAGRACPGGLADGDPVHLEAEIEEQAGTPTERHATIEGSWLLGHGIDSGDRALQALAPNSSQDVVVAGVDGSVRQSGRLVRDRGAEGAPARDEARTRRSPLRVSSSKATGSTLLPGTSCHGPSAPSSRRTSAA